MKTTIKTNSTPITIAIPVIENLDSIKKEITLVDNATTINTPTEELARLKNEFSIAKEKFKLTLKSYENAIKQVETSLNDTETLLKLKALEVVEVTTTQKVNEKTGEVISKTSHNLDTTYFSYTPEARKISIDTNEILANPDKYKKFVKEKTIYELDLDAISKADAEELPFKEIKTDAKISFKTKEK